MTQVNKVEPFRPPDVIDNLLAQPSARDQAIVSELSVRVDELRVSVTQLQQDVNSARRETIKSFEDEPPTTCEKIGLFLINILRGLGIIRN